MTQTIVVNGKDIVHKNSERTYFSDEGKTPASVAKESKTVKINKKALMLEKSMYKRNSNHETDTHGVVITDKEKTESFMSSPNVTVEGKNVCRLNTPSFHNTDCNKKIF